MRLSLKRLLIFIYLAVCAFLSFVNYRHTSAFDESIDDRQEIDIEKNRLSINSTSKSDKRLGFWQLVEAVIPRRANFFDNRSPLGGLSIDRSSDRSQNIDRALWPEDTNQSDRIVAQIRFVLDDLKSIDDSRSISKSISDNRKSISKSESKKSISIYLPHGLRSWNVEKGRGEFRKQKCQISNCYLTDYKSEAEKSDAVVFRNHFSGGFERQSSNQIWVFYTLESPENTPSLILFKDAINWTATYRYDSDLVTPYEKFRLYNDHELITRKKVDQSIRGKSIIDNVAGRKKKQVAWFVSNCLTSNRRQEYVQRLSKYIQVDIYGTCGPLKCSRYDPKCGNLLDDEYRFYLAFENSNCRDYITEKFFVQGLQHNVIPIVMGARKSDYQRVAPPHSFIHVDDFQTPADLADYLHRLSKNDTLYNEYFKWKGTGEFINTKFWCRLCAMLNAPRKKFYQDIEQWWHRPGVCSRDRWSVRENAVSLIEPSKNRASIETTIRTRPRTTTTRVNSTTKVSTRVH